jgi:dihydrofolate reductase
MVWDWDDALKDYVKELTAPVDLILLGRGLAQDFIPHWQAVAADSQHPEWDAGRMFTATPKVVFSKTIDHSPWQNTILRREADPATINALKSQKGGDIISYGGAGFASSLIRQHLIDEYHLFLNPVALGHGVPTFGELTDKLKLALIESYSFSCGITVLVYKPA